ncbi:hypothetical protein M422DRAFT_53399 [Sphaerobolus stellatus SS14]|uniref:Unplaced genomic scaffold SPHSTscaffold_168, whole genome shotgun sequence n=1 Tax=Sphaerobolus stellatus (strain SS14) TaxID=990650 RepID=A0A0C9UA07_SPHS4|nr:hypothetical protein M422DRAFT_53399 [Sphaerobolus stellatus SS14]
MVQWTSGLDLCRAPMALPFEGIRLSFSELIRRGISCNIAVQLSGPMPATLDRTNDDAIQFLSKSNRIHPPNYAPTPADFQIYTDIRLAFLRHVREAGVDEGGDFVALGGGGGQSGRCLADEL